jgi:hypothetical protein
VFIESISIFSSIALIFVNAINDTRKLNITSHNIQISIKNGIHHNIKTDNKNIEFSIIKRDNIFQKSFL